ncbi:putative Ig domain-containing protein [Streptomyces capitiformicae]|uniref:Uncharacterized protein n=1 Tax=Streptomyces capitiformicae TaxID=2014920 RepID=A0A919L2E3_9ACTN|nr:putative Ig domain-containing protein [Streptomyces capitiformicae]GHH80889.1 hypothetical protein GCM10017771_01340 [Streptomyces capitiformicae]
MHSPAGSPPSRRFLALAAGGAVSGAVVLIVTATALLTSFDAEGLPDGLDVDKKTGLISGAPKVPGTYTVTVSATNTVGTATKSLTLTVQHP